MEISNLTPNEINQNDYHKNIFTRNKIGALYTFPKRFTPEDCLACDGYVLKIVDFSELYKIIGTTFNSGTEADDEFRIPDYNLTSVTVLYPCTSNGAKELPKESLKTINSLSVSASGFSIVSSACAPDKYTS